MKFWNLPEICKVSVQTTSNMVYKLNQFVQWQWFNRPFSVPLRACLQELTFKISLRWWIWGTKNLSRVNANGCTCCFHNKKREDAWRKKMKYMDYVELFGVLRGALTFQMMVCIWNLWLEVELYLVGHSLVFFMQYITNCGSWDLRSTDKSKAYLRIWFYFPPASAFLPLVINYIKM